MAMPMFREGPCTQLLTTEPMLMASGSGCWALGKPVGKPGYSPSR